MSDFAVQIICIREILEHPNADRLEIARIHGYQSIVLKGKFKPGDLVAYIPEQAIIPPEILEEFGLTGKLAGKEHNRLRASRIRGVISQGLCYPVREGWVEGQDVTAELGVSKYEPPIPRGADGDVWSAGMIRTLRFDVQNWKNHPSVLNDGEGVVFTEKLHGTFCGIGLMPPLLVHPEHGDVVVFSKGQGSKGLVFKMGDSERAHNLYVRTFAAFEECIRRARTLGYDPDSPIFILGEIFGKGMQDFEYGHNVRDNEQIGFRIFDVRVGGGEGRFLNNEELDVFCGKTNLPRVPVLYQGPFSIDVMKVHTDGKETVSGKGTHMREGIIIKPTVERRDDTSGLGRVMLKSVSNAYLFRKGGTEYR